MTLLRFAAYWKGRPLDLQGYLDSTREFLKQLQDVHPLFNRLRYVGDAPGATIALNQDLSGLKSIVTTYAWDRRLPRSRYSALDQEGIPNLQSTCEAGYTLTLNTADRQDMSGDYAYVSVRAGKASALLTNAVVIEAPNGASPLSSRVMAEKLLSCLIQYWKPDVAHATSPALHKATRSQNDIGSIDWMTYFANPAVADALPPGVEHHPFGPGGVLIVTAPTMPSPDDPAADLARDIAQRLRDRGLMPK